MNLATPSIVRMEETKGPAQNASIGSTASFSAALRSAALTGWDRRCDPGRSTPSSAIMRGPVRVSSAGVRSPRPSRRREVEERLPSVTFSRAPRTPPSRRLDRRRRRSRREIRSRTVAIHRLGFSMRGSPRGTSHFEVGPPVNRDGEKYVGSSSAALVRAAWPPRSSVGTSEPLHRQACGTADPVHSRAWPLRSLRRTVP